MNDLISVIVPVYRTEKYLDKCIQSIVVQTHKNLEIILVDDGSPDNCPQMCDEWAKKDERIKVVHKKNGGLSSARNAGLETSSGSYIGFVDSDDFIEPDMYEILLDDIKKESSQCSACGFYYDYLDDKPTMQSAKKYKFTGKEVLAQYLKDNIRPEMCNKLYSAELIFDSKFDESVKYGEDLPFNYEILKKASCVSGVDKCLYHYLQESGNSLTTPYMTDGRAESYVITKKIVDDCSGSELYQIAVWRHVRSVFALLTRVCKSKDKSFYNKYFKAYKNEISACYKNIKSGDYSSKQKLAAFLLVNFPGLFYLLAKYAL